MRDIKFRAWHKFEKRISVVNSINFSGNYITIPIKPSKNLPVNTWSFNHIKIMQYTGLHDENGTEIYEGDIIKSSIGEKRGIVKFKAYGFEIEPLYKEYEDWGGRFSWFVNNGLEVIGNIYENPEY